MENPRSGTMGQTKAYCVLCQVGQEAAVADTLAMLTAGDAILPTLLCHVKRGESWEEHEYRFLPGHVFVYCGEILPVQAVLQVPGVLYIKQGKDDAYEMQGREAAFAQWMYQNEGIIGKSQALCEGKQTIIVSGPLKHFQDRIRKVNKLRRRAKVDIELYGETHVLWMSFDWLDGEEGI